MPDVDIFPVPEIVPDTVNVSSLGNVMPPFAVINPVAVIAPHDVIFPLVPRAKEVPVIAPAVVIDAVAVAAFLYGPIKFPSEGAVIVPDDEVTTILPVAVKPNVAFICLENVHVPFIAVFEVVFPTLIGTIVPPVVLVEQILIVPVANLPEPTPILISPDV